MKKNGGTVENWQLHHLSIPLEAVKERNPEATVTESMVFTGTIVDDPTGRFKSGHHMRSSLIVHYDPETGHVETENTIYKLMGKEGDVVPDLGDGALAIFY